MAHLSGDKGLLDAMVLHRQSTSFDYKNFDNWFQQQQSVTDPHLVRDTLSGELEALMASDAASASKVRLSEEEELQLTQALEQSRIAAEAEQGGMVTLRPPLTSRGDIWRHGGMAAWRHSGSTVTANTGGMAAQLAASFPLAAKSGGMAAWWHGGKVAAMRTARNK